MRQFLWRYDLDQSTNPYLMERLGINAAFNSGAMEFEGTIVLVVACVETLDAAPNQSLDRSRNLAEDKKAGSAPTAD